MPDPITEDQISGLLDSSKEVARYDYRNEESEDDYFSAVLYLTPAGDHFRIIETSGMDSIYMGAADSDAEWVEDKDSWANDWIETYGPSQ